MSKGFVERTPKEKKKKSNLKELDLSPSLGCSLGIS